MTRPSQVIVLVEDTRQEKFVYKYLRRLGLKEHDIRVRKSPSGGGSAEQWVRMQFPIEVAYCRRRQAKTLLVVLIDADTHTVQQRFSHLDTALRQSDGALLAGDHEFVVRLVPKRNIETWILCVNDIAVDEQTDYKRTRDDWAELIRAGAATLYAWTRPNAMLPLICVESLRMGVQELRKLDARQ